MRVSDQQIIEAIATTPSIGAACVLTGLTFNAFKGRALKLGIYDPTYLNAGRKVPLEEILEGKHPHYQTFKLKQRLLSAGLKQNKCEALGCNVESTWNNKVLQCQLDHKDGNKYNHCWVNLQMLCPNCHSQTETFSKKLPKLS